MVNEAIALFKYYILFQKPGVSTFIDEDTITLGYGKCLNLGDFQYPLPNWVVRRKYGTISWSKYLYEK